MLRYLIPAAGTLLVAGQHLSTDYSKQPKLRIETVTTYKMETTDFSMERDGEPVEGRFGGGGGSSETRRIVQIDEILEHKDSAPSVLRRTFENIEAKGEIEFGENVRETERECPLSEVTLELRIDEDGDVAVEVVEGDEPQDDALLEGHRMGLALDAFLPEDEVDEGDRWDLEVEAVLRGLGLDLEAVLFPAPEPEEPSEGEGRRGGGRRGGFGFGRGGSTAGIFAKAEWEGEATLASLDEDYGGVTCCAVTIELEASGALPEPDFGGGRRRDFGTGPFGAGAEALRPLDSTYEIKIEGRLLFSQADARPVLLELEGKVTTERVTERERQGSTMVISTTQEGTFEHVVTISKHTDE